MTIQLLKNSSLMVIINHNNISIDFLKSSIGNEDYHNPEFNYDNLFWKFSYAYNSFFDLLQKTEKELLKLRAVGKSTIDKLIIFLAQHNCYIGMFKDYSMDNFNYLNNEKVKLEDLTPEEKSLSLTMIKCLVNENTNDYELGREIRKIFNLLK